MSSSGQPITGQLLKHIPCPNGGSCVAVRCLFGHPDKIQKTASNLQASSSPKLGTGTADQRVKTISSVCQDGKSPLLIEHVNPNSLQDAGTLPDKIQPVSKTVSPSRLSPDAAPFKPRGAGPATPSSLKRKRTASPESITTVAVLDNQTAPTAESNLPAAATCTATVKKAISTAASAATKTDSQLYPQQKRKPETLNPRHLALAPAKHEIRLRLVKLLHHEFTRLNQHLRDSKECSDDRTQLLLSPHGLIKLALDIEEQYATFKSSTVYSDTLKHRILELKRMTVIQWIKERREAREKESLAGQSPSTINVPAKVQKAASWTQATESMSFDEAAAPKKSLTETIVTGLPPSQDLVLLLKHFLTPIEKLANHGFVPSVPNDADIQKARDAEAISKGWEQCERCLSRFQVFPNRRESDGALASGGQCVHHPGRFSRAKQAFDCCGESSTGNSKGCERSPGHVFKVTDPKRLACLWKFVETPQNDSLETVHAAICFDCEMAYTVHGLEVVRVTATSWPKGKVVLDTLVRPLGAIIDFNSKFSGVFASDFAAAALYSSAPTPVSPSPPTPQELSDRPVLPLVASPQEARALLHHLISPNTILIGHGLENDLRALRMVHSRVSDTALLFPHPKGLPIRYSLRVLAKEHMDRVVQAGSNVVGHDSAEDARVAGELVLVKIKKKWEAMRLDGWKLIEGEMTKGA
ncbi:RNA exonuclease 3 [Sporothrix epigloea]|uniref:RNA exonuclease 3 n=1 Tax=Sporothrix epigloea TaxID=1892477 RepID=A0ABP0DXC2_9PEZI